jgi:hypothetical protein
MPSVKFDMSDIKPLLGTLGLGQAPPPPAPINNRPIQPLQLPPTPAQAGFSLWNGDPKNQQTIANSLTMPGTPITPPNVPPASPLSSSPTPPPPAPLGSNSPIDPNASRLNLTPPQRTPMAFLNPPSATTNTPSQPYQGSFPQLSPSSPYSSLFTAPGDDKPGTAAQRAFPGPVTAASGLHDKIAAVNTTAPRPLSPSPRPFLVPPTSNPNPFGPYTPSPSAPQLPQAASSQQFAPLGQGPENPAASVQPLAGYGPSAAASAAPSGITAAAPTGAATLTAPSGPMQLLPYQNRLQTDQAELRRQQSTGSGVSQIKNPWLRTLARIGDVAGTIVAPGAALAIPGTTLHHQLLMSQQGERVQGDRQDVQDVTQSQQAAANLAHTQAETADIGTKSQQAAARYGLKAVTDDKGNTTLVPDTDSPYYKMQQDKDTKIQTQTELIQAQTESTKAQKELRDAQTAFTNNKSDPNSLVSQQVAKRLATAQQNANISAGKLHQSQLTYNARYLGTGPNGEDLAGTMITDDGRPVGSAFSGNVRPTGTERNKADMAVSADKQIADMKEIIQRNPTMFGPGYGQTTEFKKWIGGQSPDAQRFMSARTIAADHLAGTFGGRSEAALAALDNAAGQFKDNPEAALAGLDQLAGANQSFMQAGSVKTTGSNAANNAPNTKGRSPNGAKFSVTAPDGSVHPFKTQAAADRFKKLAGMTK